MRLPRKKLHVFARRFWPTSRITKLFLLAALLAAVGTTVYVAFGPRAGQEKGIISATDVEPTPVMCVEGPLSPDDSLMEILGISPDFCRFSGFTSAGPIPADQIVGRLRAEGSKLFDERGQRVTLEGFNLHGFEGEGPGFFGFWQAGGLPGAKWENVIKSIAATPANTIRFPTSAQAILYMAGDPLSFGSLDVQCGNLETGWKSMHARLCEKDKLKADMPNATANKIKFEQTIEDLKTANKKIFFDFHRVRAGGDRESIPNLGRGTLSLEQLGSFLDAGQPLNALFDSLGDAEKPVLDEIRLLRSIEIIADWYKDDEWILGIDILNEPDNNWRDWKTFAERACLVIHKRAPGMFCIVEGTGGATNDDTDLYGDHLDLHTPDGTPVELPFCTDPKINSGDPIRSAFVGGHLLMQILDPIQPPDKQKFIFSPHNYGPSVGQGGGPGDIYSTPESVLRYIVTRWGWVAMQDEFPVLLGEFGSQNSEREGSTGWGDSETKDWLIHRMYVDFIRRLGQSFTRWTFGVPKSSENTEGLLNSDYVLDPANVYALWPDFNLVIPPETIPPGKSAPDTTAKHCTVALPTQDFSRSPIAQATIDIVPATVTPVPTVTQTPTPPPPPPPVVTEGPCPGAEVDVEREKLEEEGKVAVGFKQLEDAIGIRLRAPGGAEIKGGRITVGCIVSIAVPRLFVIAGLLLLLYLIWGGYTLMLSRGDAKAMEAAKGRITSAVVGFVIIFIAFWLVRLLGVIFGIEQFTGLF